MNALSLSPAIEVVRIDLRDTAEADRIDAFVAAHPDGAVFHRPHWSRAAEAGSGHEAFYLVSRRRGAISGCLPLTRVRSLLFGDALVSAGFATGGGILAADDESARRLAEAALMLAERIGCPSVELRGGALPDGWAVHSGVYSNFSRPLPGDESALLTTIPRRQRAEIRRALDFPVTTSVGRDRAHRDAHYSV